MTDSLFSPDERDQLGNLRGPVADWLMSSRDIIVVIDAAIAQIERLPVLLQKTPRTYLRAVADRVAELYVSIEDVIDDETPDDPELAEKLAARSTQIREAATQRIEIWLQGGNPDVEPPEPPTGQYL